MLMDSKRPSARPPKPAPVSVRIVKGADAPPPSFPNRTVRPAVRANAVAALVTTAKRAPIRILLRPESRGPVGPSLDGDAVIPVGAAARETWGSACRAGDQEAIVWVPASRVNERIHELQQDPRIVDVRVSMRDVK